MIRTRVGYAGGTTLYPTYYNIGDHSETIQIDYDPTQVSYEDLLDIFWSSHRCTGQPWSRQYMSIVFYHDEGQKRLALETRDREADRLGATIFAEIVPATEFYLAEDYHQKYSLRRHPDLARELMGIYPDLSDFVDSTAVARVNAYSGGHGTLSDLQQEIDSFGLSSEGRERLLGIVRRMEP